MGAVIVVGDLVTDVLVRHGGTIEPGTDTAAAIRVGGGGQAANTAAWLAAEGTAVTLVAAVGDDAAGRDRTAELTALGVRCAVRAYAGVATGSVVVLATGDERTMLTDRGAALRLDSEHVRAAVRDVPDASHLHLSGYPLLDEGSRAAGLAALAAARERGLTTSVDAASAGPLRRVGPENFLTWVRGTDLLLCNRDEAAELAGPGTPDEQGAGLLRAASGVVVKLGAAGAVWCGAGPVLRLAQPVPVPVVVDPTGAGDAFAAGLLTAWSGGAEPTVALTAGMRLGAAAVGRAGARP